MLRVSDSLSHSKGELLCGRGPETVSRSSQYPPIPQHSVGERAFLPHPPFMMPVLAPDTAFMMPHHVDTIAPGRYAASLPMYTPDIPQFFDYYPSADSRLAANLHDPFIPTPQDFSPPTDFGGMFHQPPVAPQPPTPPAAPEITIMPNPDFQYHPCRWLGGPRCDGFAPGKNREMAEHLRVYHHFIGHERDLVSCEWQGCRQIMQRMNVARHIVSRHLLASANCRYCGRRFCRPDVVARHERTCNAAHFF